MSRFPRLQYLREQELAWSVAELAAKLPEGKPSIASIYKLESGEPLLYLNARRVFDVVNQALDGKLDPKKELVIVK